MGDDQITALKVKGFRADIQSFIDFLKSYDINSEEVRDAIKYLKIAKMLMGVFMGTLPDCGEDLNAKRDAEELDKAYSSTPSNDTPQPETPSTNEAAIPEQPEE